MTRLCGPDCGWSDEPHREPEPDWIGDMPVMHGESDHLVPDSGYDYPLGDGRTVRLGIESYCLCGHPNYFTCPEWPAGGIASMTIHRNEEQP